MDYARFGEVVEEAVAVGSLERAPLLVPVQHVPPEASPKTFLTFDERHMVTVAMDKLSRMEHPNLLELFKVDIYTILGRINQVSDSYILSTFFNCRIMIKKTLELFQRIV